MVNPMMLMDAILKDRIYENLSIESKTVKNIRAGE
jgi:hypothetical protein